MIFLLVLLCVAQAFDSGILFNIFKNLPIDVNHNYVSSHMQSTCDILRSNAKEYYIYSHNCSNLRTDVNITIGELYESLGWNEQVLLNVSHTLQHKALQVDISVKGLIDTLSFVMTICNTPSTYFPIIDHIANIGITSIHCARIDDYFEKNTALSASGVRGAYRAGNCVSYTYSEFNRHRSLIDQYIDFVTNVTKSNQHNANLLLDALDEWHELKKNEQSYHRKRRQIIEDWNRNVAVFSPETTMGHFYQKHFRHFESLNR